MNLQKEIVELFNLFKKNGYQLYIIGGAVRDYLLDRDIEDYDFATSAKPNELIKLLCDYKLDTYQKELGSVKVHINKKVYEITTFRKEFGVKDLRYPKKIEFVESLKEDVLRRDFTINTLAYSPDEGIIDFLNGMHDLNNQRIKFIKDTSISINEDLIRLIRALRFSLLLGFKISVDDLMIFHKNILKVLSLGKIKYDELFKLFKIKGCKDFIKNYFDLYSVAYPEMNNNLFIKALNSDLEEEELKYVFIHCCKDFNVNLKKIDKLILKGLKEIDTYREDLYYTKRLMIEYKDSLNKILNLLSSMGYNTNKLVDNINLIKNENHCLDIKQLAITYFDLEYLNETKRFIDKKDYRKVLNYLLDCVLIDNSLNNKEKLIELIKGD